MRRVFYGQPRDLTIDDLLTPEEQAILRKLGVASRADIDAYVQQRGRKREAIMRQQEGFGRRAGASAEADSRLSPDEYGILKMMGTDSPKDIDAYVAQREKNRAKAMRQNDASETAFTDVRATAEFSAYQVEYGQAWSRRTGLPVERYFSELRKTIEAARDQGNSQLSDTERRMCAAFGNSESAYLAAKSRQRFVPYGGIRRVKAQGLAGARAHDQGANPAGRYGLPPSPGVLKAEQDKNEAMVDDAKMRMLPATELAEMACSFIDQYTE